MDFPSSIPAVLRTRNLTANTIVLWFGGCTSCVLCISHVAQAWTYKWVWLLFGSICLGSCARTTKMIPLPFGVGCRSSWIKHYENMLCHEGEFKSKGLQSQDGVSPTRGRMWTRVLMTQLLLKHQWIWLLFLSHAWSSPIPNHRLCNTSPSTLAVAT